MDDDDRLNAYAPPSEDADRAAGVPPREPAPPATRGERLLGAITDNLIQFGFLMVVLLMSMEDGALLEDGTLDFERLDSTMTSLAVLIMAVTTLVQWVLILRDGQTIGKKWMATKIVKADGTPLGFTSGIGLRNLVPGLIAQIPVVGGIFALADALWIFGPEHRCLHDLIAGTRVISVKRT